MNERVTLLKLDRGTVLDPLIAGSHGLVQPEVERPAAELCIPLELQVAAREPGLGQFVDGDVEEAVAVRAAGVGPREPRHVVVLDRGSHGSG